MSPAILAKAIGEYDYCHCQPHIFDMMCTVNLYKAGKLVKSEVVPLSTYNEAFRMVTHQTGI